MQEVIVQYFDPADDDPSETESRGRHVPLVEQSLVSSRGGLSQPGTGATSLAWNRCPPDRLVP